MGRVWEWRVWGGGAWGGGLRPGGNEIVKTFHSAGVGVGVMEGGWG